MSHNIKSKATAIVRIQVDQDCSVTLSVHTAGRSSLNTIFVNVESGISLHIGFIHLKICSKTHLMEDLRQSRCRFLIVSKLVTNLVRVKVNDCTLVIVGNGQILSLAFGFCFLLSLCLCGSSHLLVRICLGIISLTTLILSKLIRIVQLFLCEVTSKESCIEIRLRIAIETVGVSLVHAVQLLPDRLREVNLCDHVVCNQRCDVFNFLKSVECTPLIFVGKFDIIDVYLFAIYIQSHAIIGNLLDFRVRKVDHLVCAVDYSLTSIRHLRSCFALHTALQRFVCICDFGNSHVFQCGTDCFAAVIARFHLLYDAVLKQIVCNLVAVLTSGKRTLFGTIQILPRCPLGSEFCQLGNILFLTQFRKHLLCRRLNALNVIVCDLFLVGCEDVSHLHTCDVLALVQFRLQILCILVVWINL